MQGLTKRQQMVLDFIQRSIHDHGYPPTLREIGSHMGIRSTNGVNDHLRALERKGYLKREDMKSRALRPVLNGGAEVADDNLVSVPLVGDVTAGTPVLAEANIEDMLTIDRFFVSSPRDMFAWRMRDDSMTEDGLREGDVLLVRKQLHAEPGETVLALVGEKPVVRRMVPDHDTIRLVAAHPDHAPIVLKREEFRPTQLLGVVTAMFRRF